MLIFRKVDQQVCPARLNAGVGIGPCQDPLLEFHNGVSWVGILPAEANADVEVLVASSTELESLSMLTEYSPRFAKKFSLEQSWAAGPANAR